MAQEFKNLFSPLKIGPLTVRNRIYSSPHYPMGYPERLTGLPGEKITGHILHPSTRGIMSSDNPVRWMLSERLLMLSTSTEQA